MPLFSIIGLKNLAELAPKLSLLTISTTHSKFNFDQKVYDSLLAVRKKRSDIEKLTITIRHCNASSQLQMHKDLLNVRFLNDDTCDCWDSSDDLDFLVDDYDDDDYDYDDDDYEYWHEL